MKQKSVITFCLATVCVGIKETNLVVITKVYNEQAKTPGPIVFKLSRAHLTLVKESNSHSH